MAQLPLFDSAEPYPEKIGRTLVSAVQSKSILSKASGFTDSYDFTLNPYSGCTFGCAYCYAAYFARTDELKANWGQWVQIKENALDLLKKRRKRPLTDKSIYMSTVTDAYQPLEKDLGLTRAILEELLRYHQPRLVIQTRSPLVTRDIDLLKQFNTVQVNMTVTTDDDVVRRAFEPTCPSNDRRLDAIKQIHEAGIQTCITMTPMLPVKSPQAFGEKLLATGVRKFIAQAFHPTDTRFAASTNQTARALLREFGWNDENYHATFRILQSILPDLSEGKAGFASPW